MALTDAQHATIKHLGDEIAKVNGIVREGNWKLFEYWWEVGKELEKPEYHTGPRRGEIADIDKKEILEALRLSTNRSKIYNKKSSIYTSWRVVMRARVLARRCKNESDLKAVVSEYGIWTGFVEYDPHGIKKISNQNKRRPSSQNGEWARQLLPPHDIRREIWVPAVQEFMDTNGVSFTIAYEALFGAYREMSVRRVVGMMQKFYDKTDLLHKTTSVPDTVPDSPATVNT